MKIQFDTPSGFDYFAVDSKDSPKPCLGEFVVVRRWHASGTRFSWVELKVTKVTHDYDENCVYIELKEEI
jgi:hypothetical protein